MRLGALADDDLLSFGLPDSRNEVSEKREEFTLFPPKRTKKQVVKEFFYLLKKPTPPSTDLLSGDGAGSLLIGILGATTTHALHSNMYLSVLVGSFSFYISNKICRTINYLLVEREDDPCRYFDDGILSKGL